MSTTTNKQIRQHILRNADHVRVIIKRDGQIHVRTNRQRRDDFSKRGPWTMFWGNRCDAVEQIAHAAWNENHGKS